MVWQRVTFALRTTGRWFTYVLIAVSGLVIVAGCDDSTGGAAAGSEADGPLYISGIPDQDVSVLNRQYSALSDYLSEETGLDVEYVEMVDYAALVTAFERGDIHLAWFGGLTGVQARANADGSEAFAQRPRDAEFHSRFIVQSDLEVESLEDLGGLSFTFGSESSTSGHLMPRHFLIDAGIDPEEDFSSVPNYSGSHDRTIELVQSGAYQAGALNEAVWEQRVEEGAVDTDAVRSFYTTPAYYDYNWTIQGDLDESLGSGTSESVKDAILDLDSENQEVLDLFQADGFIETANANYETIEQVARDLDLIQ